MSAAVMAVWLSRLGMGATVAMYAISILGAGFGLMSALLPKPRVAPVPIVARAAFWFGFLTTILLALYPLLCLHEGLTTVSLGNTDPVTYAAVARFLETGSLRHPPACDVSRPFTCQINHQIVWNIRPGTFLLISLFTRLFHLKPYEILTVLLAVVVALTPPLVGIFVKIASGNSLAMLIALLMSALSVNQLYFFYHGFAAQIFGEGCLVVALILFWKAECDQQHWSEYAFIMGLTISGMLELYQEDVPLFFTPLAIYFLFQLFSTNMSKWHLARRYALVVGVAFALDPFAFSYGLAWLWALRASTQFGWPMPRWALPADLVGLMDVYLPAVTERVSAIASIPVACLALWGSLQWRKPRLTISVISAASVLLLYEYGIRHYSYAYHKCAANLSFLLIGAFATGVALAVRGRYRFLGRRSAAAAAVLFLAARCFLAAIPLVKQMKGTELSVSPDLAQLTAIKQLAGIHSIRLVDDRPWQQLWAVYFLDPIPVLLDKPRSFRKWIHTGAPASPNVPTLLPKGSNDSSEYFILPEKTDPSADQVVLVRSYSNFLQTVGQGREEGRVLWRNSTYFLLLPGDRHQALRVSGQTPDRWVTSDGVTLDVPREWVRLRPTIQLSGPAVFFEHLGAHPNVTAQVYSGGQPLSEVPATIEASAGQYRLRTILNPAGLPPDGVIHLRLSFNSYFVPQKFGYTADARRLVIRMPEEVRLFR